MKFKTAISKIKNGDITIRGQSLLKRIKENSFTDTIFLLINKREPTKKESRIFEAILTSIIDHGVGTPSALATRVVTSTGNDLNTSVGAGILAIGKYHGSTIEPAMKQLQEIKENNTNVAEWVKNKLENKKVIFGFGHKIYKEEDPRKRILLELCEEQGFTSEHIEHAKEIEKQIETQKGRKIILNVDGLISAILLEMNFPPSAGNAIFLIARTSGLVAQSLEEKEREKPVRRAQEEDIVYDGE